VLGPFPAPREHKDLDRDYLSPVGGEKEHVPGAGVEVPYGKDKVIKWVRHGAGDWIVDLKDVKGLGAAQNPGKVIFYVACWLDADGKRDVRLVVGTDDGYKLWLDRKLLGEARKRRNVQPEHETYDRKLDEGTHLLLLKIDNVWGACQFRIAVTDKKGRPANGVRVRN
jgi:hypothetical protein